MIEWLENEVEGMKLDVRETVQTYYVYGGWNQESKVYLYILGDKDDVLAKLDLRVIKEALEKLE